MAYFRCGGGSGAEPLRFKGTVTMNDRLDLSAGNSSSTLSCSTKILEIQLSDDYVHLTKTTTSGCSATLSNGKLTITANKSHQQYYQESSQKTFDHSVTISYDVTAY